jgi:ribonuclease P/MRP protein subunit RPP1
MAAGMGWSGICILSEKRPDRKSQGQPGVMHGFLLRPKGPGEVAKLQRNRDETIVAVLGTSDEVNRVSCENPGVTMLLPGGGTKVDVIMARLAKENGVRIAFEFAPLLHAAPGERGKVFSQMRMNARSVRKMGAPFILSSGALSSYGLRSPPDLSSLGRLLGFSDPQVRESMGPALSEEHGKRRSGRLIMPGVEVEG